MGSVSGITVSEVILDQPEIVSPIREREAARVPEHVRMDRRQPGTRLRDRDQIIDGLTGQRLAAFRDEEPGESVRTGGQIALDRAEFIASDGMFHIQAALQTPDPQTRVGEINLVLAQQRYAKSHRILANCRGVKDFRRFRNSQDGTWFSRSVLGA